MPPKTATPHPARPQLTGKGSDEPFSFTTSLVDETGEPIVITVPSLSKAKINEYKLQLLREKSPVKAQGYALRCTLGQAEGDAVMELLAELDPEEATSFTEQWQDHSGVDRGESKAS